MSEYQKKCVQITAALADLANRYEATRKTLDELKQARIFAAIEEVRKLDLSRETLIIECATRKVEQELAAETIRDYMGAIEIIKKAIDISAPMIGSYSGQQSANANKPRGKITGESNTISSIIDRLSFEKNELGKYVDASELWRQLYSELDKAGLEPKEIKNNFKPAKTSYNYSTNTGKFRSIQRDTFENRIFLCRNKTVPGSSNGWGM
jgi:hypothetical protein